MSITENEIAPHDECDVETIIGNTDPKVNGKPLEKEFALAARVQGEFPCFPHAIGISGPWCRDIKGAICIFLQEKAP